MYNPTTQSFHICKTRALFRKDDLKHCSVTRTIREPEVFAGDLSRTFGSGSVKNVGRTPAKRSLGVTATRDSDPHDPAK